MIDCNANESGDTSVSIVGGTLNAALPIRLARNVDSVLSLGCFCYCFHSHDSQHNSYRQTCKGKIPEKYRNFQNRKFAEENKRKKMKKRSDVPEAAYVVMTVLAILLAYAFFFAPVRPLDENDFSGPPARDHRRPLPRIGGD